MKQKNKKMDLALRLLLIVLVIAAGTAVYFIVTDISKYQKGKKLYDQITDDYVLDDGGDKEPAAASESGDEADDQTEKKAEDDNGFLIPPAIDHDGLLAVNEDYIGWLRIEGCGIDLPLVIGESDSEYIHTGFNHEPVFQGTLFAEYKNNRDLADPNTVIYGHNMRNRSMFGNLRKFLNETFAEENSTFWISTKEYGYLYRIYSIAIVRADGDAYTLFPEYGDAYSAYLQDRCNDSTFKLGVTPDAEARTVTLSTCYGPGENGNRLIVQAYREGAYPAEGCTKDEAKANEQNQREKENEERTGYVMD